MPNPEMTRLAAELRKLAAVAHLPWDQNRDVKFGPKLWNNLKECMTEWIGGLQRSVIPARWEAEINYAQRAANELPHLLVAIDAQQAQIDAREEIIVETQQLLAREGYPCNC